MIVWEKILLDFFLNLGNNVKKTMSMCHIPERSHVTKPLLLSNDVVISPTEHAQQKCQINHF